MASSLACSHEVSQRSVLSPILFLLYIVDIAETLEESAFMIVNANDIIVYYNIGIDKKDARSLEKVISTLDGIKTWCQVRGLFISQEKCSAINSSRDPEQKIKLASNDIPWSPLVKILGM